MGIDLGASAPHAHPPIPARPWAIDRRDQFFDALSIHATPIAVVLGSMARFAVRLAMRWPLRHQIMGPLLAVAVVSLVAVGAIHARMAANQTRQRIENQLRGVVGVLVTTNFPLTEPVLQKMHDLSSAEFALADAGGSVSASSFAERPRRLDAGATVRRPDEVALGPALAIAGRDYFHTAVALSAQGPLSDERVLHVFFPRDEYRRSLRQAFLPPLFVGVIAVSCAAMAARLLARRISRATARLGEEVQRLARGDFSPIALPTVDDEIRDLGQAVNRTAEMLAAYEQQVRRTEQMRTIAQLGASLAHDMRNSATGCRIAVDLHAESCRCEREQESLTVAKRQLEIMEAQLQRFLQLGRRPTELVRRRVDLSRLVENLLPLVQPAANHAHVKLTWTVADEELTVTGDEDGLRQVAMNLVLNAIEAVQQHSDGRAAPRRVTIELRGAGDDAELIVSDTGPGPVASTSEVLFEPFVTTKAEGAGLGLAVAKQVVKSHGGSIAWSRDEGVTHFRVTLPREAKGAACV